MSATVSKSSKKEEVKQGKPDTGQSLLPENKIKISFKLGKELVEFFYDIQKDTPDGVAKEMVRDLNLSESQVDVIAKQIKIYITQIDSVP
jgi:hypothetical protein